jgi:hypothetical protein
MKAFALTIRQPWAYLIVTGAKRVEHRTWRTHHRGALLIHAGLEIDEAGFEDTFGAAPDRCELVRGAIVGVVEVTDMVRHGGIFHWVLANPRSIEPVECAGRLGLWVPPRRVLARLRRRGETISCH